MNQGARLKANQPAKQKQPSGRERILEAADRLFAIRGFLDVSAAEIAREAGTAHGLLFHHFGSMEALYAEVSRAAAERMDEAQLTSFRGSTPREQITGFLRSHVRSIKLREGDAIFRARALDAAVSSTIAQIWEASRQRALDKLFEVLGIDPQNKKSRACLRAWIAFHDQLVRGWLSEKSVTEAEVLEWTMGQMDQLATDILNVDLDRKS